MEEIKFIKTLQYFGKNILLKNIQKNLKVSSLYIVNTKSFAQFRKLQREENNIELMKKIQSLFNLEIKELKVLEIGLLVFNHPNNLFGDDINKWHPQDNLIYEHSKILFVNLINLNDFKRLKLFLEQYIEIFQKWKLGDKNRTMEGIIISYHYRKEHLNKINNANNLDKLQKNNMKEQLEKQLVSLKKSLGLIDPEFPISALENNHKELFDKYKEGWTETFDKVKNVVLESYLKHLKYGIDSGNYSVIQNELLGISKRLLAISPKKIIVSLSKKMNEDVINEIFEDFSFSNSNLLNLLLLYIDTVIVFDAPINDEDNKKWKEELLLLLKLDINEGLPEIIIRINKKIDFIMNQMQRLVNDN